MKVLTTSVARILFALPFGIFGLNHLMYAGRMKGLVPSWVPGGGQLWVYITGICLIIACVFIASNMKHAGTFSFLLAILLLAIILTIHVPGIMNTQTMQMAMAGMLKDTALMGGALTYAGILSKKK